MRKYSFQKRMIFINISIIVAVITLLFLVAFIYLMEISNSNFEQQLQVRTEGFSSYIDNAVQVADDISLQLAANNYIIEEFQAIQSDEAAAEAGNYFISHPVTETRVKKFMTSYTLKKSSISRICLFDVYQNFTFIGNAVDYGYLEKNNRDGQFMEDITGHFALTGEPKLLKVYEQDPFYSGEEYILAVTREIKNYVLVPSEAIGYVQVHIPARNLKRHFDALEFGGEAYIIDNRSGDIIFQHNAGEEGIERLADMWQSGRLSGDIMQPEQGLYMKAREIPDMDLWVVMAEANQDVMCYAMTTLFWFLVLIICMIALVTAGQVQLIKRTTKPIIELCELVESLETDADLLEIPMVDSGESDELRNLNHAFNGLVKNLNLSMEHRLNSQINELKAHMFALQSQMNPHFIHNILAIISAMSTRKEYQQIPAVCEQLSAMIRYTTTFNDSYIPVAEEVMHAVNYLELMKLRYEERFEYSISYASGDLSYRIPKFIFQPLIENSFQHGFKTKEFPWKMELLLFTRGAYWELQVRDNGTGISPEKQAEIDASLTKIRATDMKTLMGELAIGGLSLKNIYARLWIAYGEAMIFAIDSSEGAGSEIRIGGKMHDQSDDSGR